ncbi:MAG TPA: M20 family metallopeptidase [Mycobacteriales bacterium]|nr:M20 family metallopeptidase [Mycobacteriales bacterium]
MDTAENEQLVEFTRKLVRLPTVNDAGRGEAPAAHLVVELMRSWGWAPLVEEIEPGRPNVIAVVDGGRPGPTLLFEGHTDVVTEGDRTQWSVDPFGAEIRDGRLYGRGSADMKSGVAAMLFAARRLQLAGPFPGRIKLAVLVDEEGMMLGAKHFVAAGHAADVDAAIVCEPEAEEVCLTAKGAIRVRLDLHGAMAHGAMPDHGRNPVPVLGSILGWLAGYQAELQESAGRHPHLGLPYVTPTVVGAGDLDQVNVIGADAVLALDIRTVPGLDHSAIVAAIKKNAESIAVAAGVTVMATVIDDRPATETAANSAVARAVMAAHQDITGEPAVIGGVPGATDGTILWRDAGLPVVVYGPGGKWIAHQVDEFVEVADIVRKARVYVRAAELFLAGSG